MRIFAVRTMGSNSREDQMELTEREINVVRNLGSHLQFVSDSQDVAAIKRHLGTRSDGYDSFFVAGENGDYTEVWGMCGIIPRMSKLVSRFV